MKKGRLWLKIHLYIHIYVRSGERKNGSIQKKYRKWIFENIFYFPNEIYVVKCQLGVSNLRQIVDPHIYYIVRMFIQSYKYTHTQFNYHNCQSDMIREEKTDILWCPLSDAITDLVDRYIRFLLFVFMAWFVPLIRDIIFFKFRTYDINYG